MQNHCHNVIFHDMLFYQMDISSCQEKLKCSWWPARSADGQSMAPRSSEHAEEILVVIQSVAGV